MKLPKEWYINILDCLNELSDKEFQEKVWVRGECVIMSSFAECVCSLFDDSALSEMFEDSTSYVFNEEIDSSLKRIGNLIDNIDNTLGDKDIIEHKNIKIIRDVARKTMDTIKREVKY